MTRKARRPTDRELVRIAERRIARLEKTLARMEQTLQFHGWWIADRKRAAADLDPVCSR